MHVTTQKVEPHLAVASRISPDLIQGYFKCRQSKGKQPAFSMWGMARLHRGGVQNVSALGSDF